MLKQLYNQITVVFTKILINDLLDPTPILPTFSTSAKERLTSIHVASRLPGGKGTGREGTTTGVEQRGKLHRWNNSTLTLVNAVEAQYRYRLPRYHVEEDQRWKPENPDCGCSASPFILILSPRIFFFFSSCSLDPSRPFAIGVKILVTGYNVTRNRTPCRSRYTRSNTLERIVSLHESIAWSEI